MKNSKAMAQNQFCRHAKRFGLNVEEYRARRARGECFCPICNEWKSADNFHAIPRDQVTKKCRDCKRKVVSL